MSRSPRRKRKAIPDTDVGASNACGRVAYRSRKIARRVAQKLNQTLRPYRCPGCDLFHNGTLPHNIITGQVGRDVMTGRTPGGRTRVPGG